MYREKDPCFVPPIVLKAEGLVKIYGKRRVVDGVNFHVNKGEIVGLLGPNGAGKTTSFRMTCGLINTNGGAVYLGTQEVTNWPMYRRSKEGGMGYLPQEKSVFQKLSVQNNLHGVMELLGIKRSERKRRCNELLEKFGLTHLRRNLAGGLSGGERRRLEIARALVSDPKIILLDEPFAAIDPVTVISIQTIIRQLAAEGISILVTDHKEQATLEITQRSYIIQSGRVLCHGTPAEVLANPEARKVYFGDNVNIPSISGIHTPSAVSAPIPEMPVDDTPPPSKRLVGHRHGNVKKEVEPREARKTEPSPTLERVRSRSGGIELEKAATNLPLAPHPTPIGHHEKTVSDSGQSRPIGRRLVPTTAERPLVRSNAVLPNPETIVKPAEHSDAPAASGVIRTLGAMIWGK